MLGAAAGFAFPAAFFDVRGGAFRGAEVFLDLVVGFFTVVAGAGTNGGSSVRGACAKLLISATEPALVCLDAMLFFFLALVDGSANGEAVANFPLPGFRGPAPAGEGSCLVLALPRSSGAMGGVSFAAAMRVTELVAALRVRVGRDAIRRVVLADWM